MMTTVQKSKPKCSPFLVGWIVLSIVSYLAMTWAIVTKYHCIGVGPLLVQTPVNIFVVVYSWKKKKAAKK